MKPILLILMIALFASAAPAFDKSDVFSIAGSATDFASTVTTPGRELNPVMGQGWKQQAAMTAGSTALTLLLAKMFRDTGHPKAAKVLNYISGSIHFGVGVSNWQRLGFK